MIVFRAYYDNTHPTHTYKAEEHTHTYKHRPWLSQRSAAAAAAAAAASWQTVERAKQLDWWCCTTGGSGLIKKCVGFPMHLLGLSSEAKRNPLKERARSATLDVQSTATDLDRDRDMRRDVPMAVLLSPRPRSREQTLGRQRTASQNKQMHILGRRICCTCSWRNILKKSPCFSGIEYNYFILLLFLFFVYK